MKRANTSLLFTLALLILSATLASAQAYGRFILTLRTEAGDPLQGVTVRATCDQLPQFEKSVETDKKGRATFTFVDATKVYTLHIDHEGYAPAEFTVKAELRGVRRQTVHLPEADKAQPRAQTKPQAQPKAAKLTADRATFNEGVEALQRDDLAGAEEKFRAALEINDKLAPAYSGLAGLYLSQGKSEAALEAAQQLLTLAPDDLRGLRLLYEAHKNLGYTQEAKAARDRLSELGDSDNAATMIYNEGVAALKVGDRAAARARFEEALAMSPTLVAAQIGLATVDMGEKKYTEAAAHAEQALATEPDHLQALRLRFDAYRLLKDPAKTEEALANLAQRDPDGIFKWLFDTGVELFEGGNIQSAVDQLERALSVRPDEPNVLYRLGLSYTNLDQKAKAIEAFQKFLEVSPDHPEAPVAKEMLTYLK